MNPIKSLETCFQIAFSLLIVLCAGCGTATPGEESVLSGTWELTKDDDPNGEKYLLTFNAFGSLTTFATVNGNTTVTTSNFSSTTTVTGQAVTIKTSQHNLKFVGTFNAGFTIANGTLFAEWELFGSTTTRDLGEATLTKTATP